MLWKFPASKWLFDVLWEFATIRNAGLLIELEECPYCGFRETFDFWCERNMDQTYKNGMFSGGLLES